MRQEPPKTIRLLLGPAIAAWLICAAAGPLSGAVRLPAVIGDHMVLQRQSEAVLWGWADPGERVSVKGSWLEQAAETEAAEDGSWRVALAAPPEGGPHTILFEGEANRILVEDVLSGEVWLCSGQSNMEMPLAPVSDGYTGVLDWAREVAASDLPGIRVFDVANDLDAAPRTDCEGAWRVASPATAGNFSATAFFFGRALHAALRVPVGLITSDWGGTPAGAWTPREGLAGMEEFAADLERTDLLRTDPAAAEAAYKAEMRAWWRSAEDTGPGAISRHWMAPDFADEDWSLMVLPSPWEEAGLEDFDGVVWFRKTVELPPEWEGQDLWIDLGPIDDMDTAWFNGERIGGLEDIGRWQEDRRYAVPGALVRAGRNVIAVRVVDTGGQGGFCGSPDEMLLGRAAPGEDRGDREAADPADQAIALSGAWRFRPGPSIDSLPPLPESRLGTHTPTVLYNAMIAPLLPFRFRGAIWYQGESNRSRAALYDRLFPALIESWRRAFDCGPFPFYFVQIAPFDYGGIGGEGDGSAEKTSRIREAQQKTLALENTGMVVTLDLGNAGDIHPKNKQEVGRRLALWALAETYGREGIACRGPSCTGLEQEGSSIRLLFDDVGEGLIASGGEPLRGFEAAGEDGVFAPARAWIEGQSVVVQSDGVPSPRAVRYAWGDVPDGNLFNRTGLPAAPFLLGGP